MLCRASCSLSAPMLSDNILTVGRCSAKVPLNVMPERLSAHTSNDLLGW